ncbi:unnamed protein product [Adineta steineri]|uniref:Uncharacterized protein n=1 Tax=Adineta steineri TaxID=433720 RepID=A0A813VXI7_9BILA|nr:unnamed protein product [Adineta steineri]CAF1172101.1 unnamed protein product [Adineta steineri]
MTTTGIDLRSITVDLSSCPTVGTQSSFQSQTTDYSELLRKIAGINTISFTCSIICIAFDLIFTLITLGIGGANQSSCPMEPRIPMYLIVLGSINLISICFSIVACIIHHREKDKTIIGFYYVHCTAILIIILQLFNFIWVIIGSIWTFRIYMNVQYTESDQVNYCQGNVYQFTIISIIFQYVLPLVFCCCKNVPFNF